MFKFQPYPGNDTCNSPSSCEIGNLRIGFQSNYVHVCIDRKGIQTFKCCKYTDGILRKMEHTHLQSLCIITNNDPQVHVQKQKILTEYFFSNNQNWISKGSSVEYKIFFGTLQVKNRALA